MLVEGAPVHTCTPREHVSGYMWNCELLVTIVLCLNPDINKHEPPESI